MAATTGLAIVNTAFGLLNIYSPNESVSANDGEFARTLLNLILSQWRQRRLMVPMVVRERFDMIVDKGSPSDPYTIGPSGNFNTERPANQNAIEAANLILTTSNPEVRIPLSIFTDDGYFANQVPSNQSTQPTGLYYNPTYANDLGSIYLWNVPNSATNDLELLLQKPIAKFATLTSTVYLPDGADDALTYALAKRLAGPYGRTMSRDDQQTGTAALDAFKRSNIHLSELSNDAAWATGRHGMYNILSDTTGG